LLRRRPAWRAWAALAGCGAVLALLPSAHAADIPVSLVGGTPCVRGTLAAGAKSIPVNFVLDLGSTQALRVHDKTAEMLALGPANPARVKLGEFDAGEFPAGAADGRLLDELSRAYSEALNEIPASALLGLTAFAGQDVQLDLSAGTLRLLPPAADSTDDQANSALAFTVPYLERAGSLWLSVRGPQDTPLYARFAALQTDTLLDAGRAAELGAPGGNVSTLRIGPLELTEVVALRPEPPTGHLRADLTLGTNLLTTYRVTVRPTTQRISFERTRAVRFPTEEQAYFIARAEQNAERIALFLEQNPESRLVREAAQQLLKFRLQDPLTSAEEVMTAVRSRAGCEREDRRAQAMSEMADAVAASQRKDRYPLATRVLEAALAYAPQDLNARAGHEIQARLGYYALRQDDLAAARVHLLSAAFGLPRDATVNLLLGELYERTGKATRAWSRYMEAAISREAPPEAFAALDRLNREPGFRAAFSMADAEQLLEGRIDEFHPSERFARVHAARRPALRLIESFLSSEQPESAAPERAAAGLAEYLADPNVLCISYHLAVPAPDALASGVGVTRLLFNEADTTPLLLIDGRTALTLAGDERATDEVWAAYRRAVDDAHATESPWRLSGAVEVGDGQLRGHVDVEGPAAPAELRVFALLCERVVMAPTRNGVVLHRNVARHGFAPADGFALSSAAGRRSFELTLAFPELSDVLTKRLERAQQEGSFAFSVHPTYVDPAACLIAAFVQDATTHEVLGVCAIPVRTAGSAAP
jgi:hypothetical protein